MRPEGERSRENGSPFDLGALGASAVSSLLLSRDDRASLGLGIAR